ncbi:MAG: hypothetical protein NW216_09055 [Hyphomicrobium sp.]|nr:hypothetical protein [Hyphomicrobium sp.]
MFRNLWTSSSVFIRHFQFRRSARAVVTLIPFAGGYALLVPEAAEAQYRRPPPIVAELPPPMGKGCYYYRGREHCGSYCYWEVNGKRYCQERAREAFSQAPVVIDDGFGIPMK